MSSYYFVFYIPEEAFPHYHVFKLEFFVSRCKTLAGTNAKRLTFVVNI